MHEDAAIAQAAAHSLGPDEVILAQQTDHRSGLPTAEASRRFAQWGPNALPEGARWTLAQAFIAQFANFLILLLIGATVLAAAIGEFLDAGTIAAIVVLSAALGVAQEWRAERALEGLQAMMAPAARVLRDGHVREIPARTLVPGDIVLLEVGRYVPADLRLVETFDLAIDEASLTGESAPVTKDADAVLDAETPVADRVNCAFSGTLVTAGRATGVVTGTGTATEIGRIATLIGGYEEGESPLQRRMSELGRLLGAGAIVVAIVVFAVGSLRGEDVAEMLLTSVSLAVAAVPEGLPAVVTIGLALGMQRMAGRSALVRRLSAVETLGSATVIASDKTGTLTKGEMTVVELYLGPDRRSVIVEGAGYEPAGRFVDGGDGIDPLADARIRELATAAALCNDAALEYEEGQWRVVGDTTEGALLVLGAKAGIDLAEASATRSREAEVAFTSERRRMTTIHAGGDALVAYVKGAPDAIIERCSRRLTDGGAEAGLDEDTRAAIVEANEELAGRGLRVLALGRRAVERGLRGDVVEQDLVFLGLVALQDPPRPEARDAVAVAHRAGIVPLMITGDHAATARTIARDLGIADASAEVIDGTSLAKMGKSELRNTLETARVFARISPEQKVRIVDAVRDRGEIIAVTGDGVNDAPALKRADIGVAMGITGTDVAKEASDMVITDDNFASIVAAVEEGRKIFANIRNFVVYLLGANIGEILIIFLAVAAGLPLPLLPMQLLWVNLVTDSLPALALTMEPGEADAMSRSPRPPREPIVTRAIGATLAIRGVAEAAAVLAVFILWLEAFDASDDEARTVTFATLVVAELLKAYGSRSLYRSALAGGPFGNVYLVGGTGISFLMLLAVLYVPPLQEAFHVEVLGAGEWVAIAGFGAVPLIVTELQKIGPWRLRG